MNPQTQNQQDQLYTGLITNFSVGVGLFLIFIIIRRKMKRVFGASQLAVFPTSWFSWIWPMLTRDTENICKHHGLDVAMHIMILRHIFFMILLIGVFSLLITLPIDGTATGKNLPEVLTDLIRSLPGAVNETLVDVVNAANTVVTAATTTVDAITPVATGTIDAITPVATGTIDAITPVATAVGAAVVDSVTPVIQGLGPITVSPIPPNLAPLATGAAGTITPVAGGFISPVLGLVELESLRVQGLAILSIEDLVVPFDSGRFWVHAVSVFWNSIICFVVLWKMWEKYFGLRRMMRQGTGSYNYTVFATHVPKTMSNSELYDYFNKLYPGEILGIRRVQKYKQIVELKGERMKWVYAYESTLQKETDTSETQYTHPWPLRFLWLGKILKCFDNTPALPYYQDRITDTEQQIENLQQEYKKHFKPFAYIVFRHKVPAMSCASEYMERMHLYPAPHPHDIKWMNHTVGKVPKSIFYWIAHIIIFFLLIFWVVITAIITSFANLETLANIIPGLGRIPVRLSNLIGAVLPGIVLTLCFILLKIILVKLINLYRPTTHSKIDVEVFRKLFIFYVINVLFVSAIATSFFGIIDQLLGLAVLSLQGVVVLIAKTIASQSIFFMNYILTVAVITQFFVLLHPVDIFMRYVYHRYFASTPRKKAKAKNLTAHYSIPLTISRHCLIFLITMCYSSIVPLIIPFGFLYFCVVIFVNSHDLIYVHRQDYDGLGVLFPTISNTILFCIVLYQVIVGGIFLIKFFYEGVILVALILIGTCFYWHYLNKRFTMPARYGLGDDAVNDNGLELDEESPDYLHPARYSAKKDLEDIERFAVNYHPEGGP
jgi:hypothetical protein